MKCTQVTVRRSNTEAMVHVTCGVLWRAEMEWSGEHSFLKKKYQRYNKPSNTPPKNPKQTNKTNKQTKKKPQKNKQIDKTKDTKHFKSSTNDGNY